MQGVICITENLKQTENLHHFLATIWQTYRFTFGINACFYDHGNFSFFLHLVKIIFLCDYGKFSFMVTAIFSMHHGIFWCANHGNFLAPTTVYIWTNFKISYKPWQFISCCTATFSIFVHHGSFCSLPSIMAFFIYVGTV